MCIDGHTDAAPPGLQRHERLMDRKEGSIGYVIDNVQLVCWRINEMKNDQPEHQLLWWARALVANDENHRRSSAEA